jgi:hypothetical protein
MHTLIKPISYATHKIKHVPEIEQQLVRARLHNASYQLIHLNSSKAPSLSVPNLFTALVTNTTVSAYSCCKELCLKLGHHGQTLNPGDLTRIATTLTIRCPQLKRLTIVFSSSFHQISGVDAKNFAFAIKSLKQLEKLSIIFIDKITVNELDLTKIISAGKAARKLKELNFHFGYSLNFGPLVCASLAKVLNYPVKLMKVRLVMENATTHQRLLSLAMALAKLGQISDFELSLSFNWGYRGMAELSDSLARLATVKQLKLD